MLSNYFRIAFRALAKNKIYSFINISGFAIGITCTLLILLWVHDELTYDTWMPNYDRVYRLMTKANYDGSVHMWNANPIPSAEGIKEESASIVNTAITDWGMSHLLATGKGEGVNKHGLYTSDAFLTIFGNKMIYGNAATALKDMKSIVLTRSTAKVLFGDENPMDKIVRLDDMHDLKVTGMIDDIPSNSSLTFDFLITFSLYETTPWVKMAKDHWDYNSFAVYVELADPSDAEKVNNEIKTLPSKYAKEGDLKKEFWLHPISRWHLHSEFNDGVEAGGMITYVKAFGVIACLVLFIACVNFMNLATARAEKRAVEVGVRKSVGSKRSDLISQFIWESVVTTAIAFVGGLVLAQLLLPYYNQLVSKQLTIPYLSPLFAGICLLTIFGVGVLAGSYPAFYLSAFKPVSVLKGGKGATKSGGLSRKFLVAIQFGFSMILILGTIVIYQQIEHARVRDTGFNPDNLITVGYSNDIRKNYKAVKSALLQTGVVESVTKSNDAITNQNSWNAIEWPGKPPEQKLFFAITATEYDYVKTMGLKLLEGRDFSEEFKSDSTGIIVNRAAVELMGVKEPIGSIVTIPPNQNYHIIGVIENTVNGDPNSIPGPAVVRFIPEWSGVVTIRTVAGVPVTESIKKIEAVFKTFSPAYPFDFKFVDDEYQRKFTTINLTSRLASIFALLTLIITGLGLFGLAAFTAAQRTRELGIRKVMGASVQQLVQLISADFSWLVVIAFVVSSPIAWWLIREYLQQYAYRVDVQWWLFPLTGLIALLFAMVIVSTQAFRAARSNPAQSLRNE